MTYKELIDYNRTSIPDDEVSLVSTYVTDKQGNLLDDNEVRVRDEIVELAQDANPNEALYDREEISFEELSQVIVPDTKDKASSEKYTKNEAQETGISLSKDEAYSSVDDIIDNGKVIYLGESKILENLVPVKEEDSGKSAVEEFMIGAEVGSNVGQFLSNRKLYDSSAYKTIQKKDPSFSYRSPEVVAILNDTPTNLLTDIENATSLDGLKLIIERNKYNQELLNDYNTAGFSKYLGLATTMVADPLNAVPIAGGLKLLNSTVSVSKKLGGYAAVGATYGSTDEYLRGTMQQTESNIGSGAFWGGVTMTGLGGLSHLIGKGSGINLKGTTDSLLDSSKATAEAKSSFMNTPTDNLQQSGSAAFEELGSKLNRGATNKEGQLVEINANDIKYQVMNLGAQGEAEFKEAYKQALQQGYTGTYDEYLEDGLGEIIGSKVHVTRFNVVPDGEIHTTDTTNKIIADSSVGGPDMIYSELPQEFIPLANAIDSNNVRLQKYLDDVLPDSKTTLDIDAPKHLEAKDAEIKAQQQKIQELELSKADEKLLVEERTILQRLLTSKDVLVRNIQRMTDASKLKATLTQGASHLTKYFTINTKAVANISKESFVNKMLDATTRLDGAPPEIKASARSVYGKAYDEILAKYTRGDTEDFIINKLLTYSEVPLFDDLLNKINPLDAKGIMYSDAGIASHYFHTELAGNTGLVAKGLSLNDDMFRVQLEEVSKRALDEGVDAESIRKLSTQALDLYRQIRGDYMPMPSAGGYGQAVKAFNNITYSAVGGGFGVLSVLDIAVGVAANGFKNTLKAIGPAFKSMVSQIQNKNPDAIQEALELGAGGEMMMSVLRSRFYELDGVSTSRTLNKVNTEALNPLEKLVAGTDWLADKVSTMSGLRHITSWLQYTAMYASMNKIIQMAKKSSLSAKEHRWLADKGLNHYDIQQIPTDKMDFSADGKAVRYNFTQWGEETHELQQKMIVASNRAVNNAVIKADVTELPNWFNHLGSSPTGSMITAFMKYVVASHGSIMKRGYNSDKAQFFEGVATAASILMVSKVVREEAMVASGVMDESDKKYRIFDSLGNLDEEGLSKLAYDTVTFLPQMGAVSVGTDLMQTLTNTSLTGEDVYSVNQTRALGNINNILNLGAHVGKEVSGHADAIDRLYQLKSVAPMNNLYYLDSLYMPSLKDAVE